MNIKVVNKPVLDWKDGVASLFEVYTQTEEKYNLNILHRAGTYVLYNSATMTVADFERHQNIVQIAINDIRNGLIKKTSNNIDCLNVGIESLMVLQFSDKPACIEFRESHGKWVELAIFNLNLMLTPQLLGALV